MADRSKNKVPALKEYVMRYYPAALALSLFCALSASVGSSATPEPGAGVASLRARGP